MHLHVLEGWVLAEQGGGDHHLVVAGVQLPHGKYVGLLTSGQAGIPQLRRATHGAHGGFHVALTAPLEHLQKAKHAGPFLCLMGGIASDPQPGFIAGQGGGLKFQTSC